MRRLILLVYFSMLCSVAFPQKIEGFWNGRVDLMGSPLRIVFELTSNESGLSGVMKSPDQGPKETELSKVEFRNDSLNIEASSLDIHYRGRFDPKHEKVTGVLTQRGMQLLCILQREPLEALKPDRPQNPQGPFPYLAEEVSFQAHEPEYTLYGTLTLPKEKIVAGVVLITGSGPQNRDSQLFDHLPFKVWADELTRSGIAVLRYDERGVGESQGTFSTCTSIDFAHDAMQALRLLGSTLGDSIPIGFMGHSEGGLVAAIASANADEVDFVVSLAGPGLPGAEVLATQTYDIALGEGLTRADASRRAESNSRVYDIITAGTDSTEIAIALREHFKAKPSNEPFESAEDEFATFNKAGNNIWMRGFLNIDPRDYWSKVHCPVLAINGNKDLQVQASANLRAIEFSLRRGGNPQVKTVILKNHNHLFQRSETGALSEYGRLSETLSPEVLSTVKVWILQMAEAQGE